MAAIDSVATALKRDRAEVARAAFIALLARYIGSGPVAIAHRTHGRDPWDRVEFTYGDDSSLSHLLDSVRPAQTPAGYLFQFDVSQKPAEPHDLALTLHERDRNLFGIVSWNAELLDRAHVERIPGHWAALIEAAVQMPEAAIAKLRLLPEREHQQIVHDWNDTTGAFPDTRLMHQLFEDRVRIDPQAIAVATKLYSFSYGEINARANQLARLLQAKGITRGAFVGVCMHRSESMIVAVLAVLKAGAAYVPLDASYPRERIAFMIADAKMPLILTESALCEHQPEGVAEFVQLDQLEAELQQYAADDLPAEGSPDDRAYVIYTSGSTGTPKGVLLRHRPVVNTIDWVNRTFNVGPRDRLLFVTSLSFDLSVYDIFGTLAAGGSIRIANEQELRDPAALLTVLAHDGITIWDSAPAALSQLVPFFSSRSIFGGRSEASVNSLRLVMLSGDWIPVPLPDQVRQSFPGAKVVGLGGATEAAIWSNWFPIEKVDPRWPSIPYGKPIRNARYHVLDAHLQPQPVGVPGELYIAGEVLADGYLNRDDLTAERFIPDPFWNSVPGARMYRTGDLARYMPDGNIEFLGRVDNQVKVRGYRVEIGEIETVAGQYPGVREVVVKAHRDSGEQNFLVAYVVPSSQCVDESALQDFLRNKLPEYMVPARVCVLDAIPRTPNGKIDRGALQPPAVESVDARQYEEPLDSVEAAVAEVWTDVLGGEKVGRNDHFFAMGGHSLRAAQAVARLQQRFDIDLNLPSLFEHPTVARFAEIIRQAKRASVIVPRPGVEKAAASLIQQRFWFLDRNIADRTIYNVADAFHMRGPLNVDAFQAAWQDVVARQDSLRTVFHNVDGWPEQEIRSTMAVTVPVVDLSGHVNPAEEAKRLIAEDARGPFDVDAGPLYRIRLLKLGVDEHVLNWTFHHLIIDESSRTILLNDLWSAYANRCQQRPTASKLPVRYIDYSFWQRDQMTTAAVDYWKQKLKGTPPPLVPPHSLARPAQRSFRGTTVPFSVSDAVSRAIAGISRQARVTPYIVWLAAFKTFLQRCTGQTDICIGSPISTRPAAMREVAGCFVNSVVLRTDLAGDISFTELLKRTRDTLTGAIQHGDVPFEKLVEELRPERIPGGHPLFQTLFVYQAEQLHGRAHGDLVWHHDAMERVGAKFDFTLTIEENNGHTTGFIEYAHDLYDAESIARYVGRFQTLIEGIAARPGAKLADLPILPATERELVLYGFNNTAVEYPRTQCVHQLVEEQAARTPNEVAFEFKGKTLSFRELNEGANRLAHHLRALGVVPDTLVGLCVERGLDMPVAMLGILKSGGAYLPLDPDFPPERLSFYLEDSKSPIIVAHGHFLDNLPVEKMMRVRVDEDAEAIAKNPADNPPNVNKPGDTMYVLYTSGSTGRPNGVAVQHQSLVNLFWSFKDQPGLRKNDTIFSITTLSFDIHTVETWLPMVMGARSIIIPRDVALNGQRLAEMVHDHDATVMQSTPATWRLLVASGWKGKPDLRVWCGGEPLTVELHQQLTERVAELWNVYGPTETAVWSVIHKTRPTDRIMYIGRPIANTQIYLLDTQWQPVPLGCVGEIWIAGDGLARGYLDRPELTGARFLPDPFSNIPGNRMYKTGDLGRLHPDGMIECLGRVDHQVKVRGFRIELNEIERVLEEYEGLAQAVVTARTDDEFAAMINAYYRCEPGHAPTPADLRKYAQSRLPDYMVPATFTRLEEFPQTPNGKVDRKALPAPTIEAAAVLTDRVFVPAGNDAERALLAIWEEVLGIKPLSVTDNFHEVGGHSLLAAVLMSQIESRLGHRLSLEVLFAHPTVRSLADALNARLELGKGSMVPLQTGGKLPPLILIAGVGGHVFAFHKFARELGSDFPVYGMKAIGINGDEPPLERFEEIAARYVKEILAERPDGPYVLGGYSVGGRIAMEVALQLQALGKQVPRLIVVDMFAPGFPKAYPLAKRLRIHAWRLLKLPLREKFAFAKQRLLRLMKRVNVEVFQDVMVKQLDVVPQQVLADVGNALLRANDNYMPTTKYDGKVVLVQSDVIEEWEEAVERVEVQGWTPWSTEPVESHTLRAAHLEMFADHVQPALAIVVRKTINEVAAAKRRG